MGRSGRRSGVISMVFELAAFMRANKRWWLLPPIILLLLLAGLIVLGESSALAPFIYTLF